MSQVIRASTSGVSDHGALTGLSDDDHTQYALLAGRAGGQSLALGTVTTPGETLHTSGNIRIPTTSSSVGIIKQDTSRLLHTYGTNNVFLGIDAGNFTMTGAGNTAVGTAALFSNTTGADNFALGTSTLVINTTGSGNVAIGRTALTSNVTGSFNVGLGAYALYTNTASSNIGIGYFALVTNTSGAGNVGIGGAALYANDTGSSNTAIGVSAGYTDVAGNANVSGSNNTWVGYQSGPGSATQLTNSTAIGYQAKVTANDSLVLGAAGVKVGIGTTAPSAVLDINSDILRLRTAKTPASASAAGATGDIAWDSGFIYVCTATNTWKRVAIATW